MGPEVFVAEGALLKLVLATDGSGLRWSEAATAGHSWSLLPTIAGACYCWPQLEPTIAGACYCWPQLEPTIAGACYCGPQLATAGAYYSWSLLLLATAGACYC